MTTLTEAIARLSNAQSLAEIKTLALEFSAAATKTNAILYSGMLDATTPAYEVAGRLAAQLDLAIITDTPSPQPAPSCFACHFGPGPRM
jgi:hypothetical protein